ncbi:MAG: 2-hydroxyglutaryl-CoA dehydratase [Candidatus Merdivicinus sp.]|jgi:predicted nucleotide-binding protein (sugar kinase/HSP70/actin superfamily)
MERPVFTKEMKETHTILLPTMLPIHFNLMSQILNQHGYHSVVLANDSRSVVNEGLRNVHNDTCYPALLVIGQFIDALESGKYDLDKVALMITQTGGGCRASNYIHLLRKALEKSGYGHIPVISLSFGGLESNPGFKLTLPLIIQFLYAVLLGDLLTLLSNQCTPYEVQKGDTQAMVNRWQKRLLDEFASTRIVHYSHIQKFYDEILADFAKIPKTGEKKIRVGIVGEIYVKYSPLGNNNLESFLLSEGAEVVVPGLLDFCMYCVYNGLVDQKLYGGSRTKYQISQFAYRYLLKKQKDVIAAIERQGVFQAQTPFDKTVTLSEPYISHGVKMGEGWLLTAEILELIDEGVLNVICTQPFGCLPNHIVAKGMIRSIKEQNPDANLVAVDYDPGASAVNQQNRIKLMLANAKAE